MSGHPRKSLRAGGSQLFAFNVAFSLLVPLLLSILLKKSLFSSTAAPMGTVLALPTILASPASAGRSGDSRGTAMGSPGDTIGETLLAWRMKSEGALPGPQKEDEGISSKRTKTDNAPPTPSPHQAGGKPPELHFPCTLNSQAPKEDAGSRIHFDEQGGDSCCFRAYIPFAPAGATEVAAGAPVAPPAASASFPFFQMALACRFVRATVAVAAVAPEVPTTVA